jgi:hypothetical protein
MDENTTTPTEGGGDIIIVYIIYRCIAITDLCNLMVIDGWTKLAISDVLIYILNFLIKNK